MAKTTGSCKLAPPHPSRAELGHSLNLYICPIVAFAGDGSRDAEARLSPELAVNRSVVVWQS